MKCLDPVPDCTTEVFVKQINQININLHLEDPRLSELAGVFERIKFLWVTNALNLSASEGVIIKVPSSLLRPGQRSFPELYQPPSDK